MARSPIWRVRQLVMVEATALAFGTSSPVVRVTVSSTGAESLVTGVIALVTYAMFEGWKLKSLFRPQVLLVRSPKTSLNIGRQQSNHRTFDTNRLCG